MPPSEEMWRSVFRVIALVGERFPPPTLDLDLPTGGLATIFRPEMERHLCYDVLGVTADFVRDSMPGVLEAAQVQGLLLHSILHAVGVDDGAPAGTVYSKLAEPYLGQFRLFILPATSGGVAASACVLTLNLRAAWAACGIQPCFPVPSDVPPEQGTLLFQAGTSFAQIPGKATKWLLWALRVMTVIVTDRVLGLAQTIDTLLDPQDEVMPELPASWVDTYSAVRTRHSSRLLE